MSNTEAMIEVIQSMEKMLNRQEDTIVEQAAKISELEQTIAGLQRQIDKHHRNAALSNIEQRQYYL